ncbi:hypothetical protein Xen7305DRAFT_00009160 [Xenococcus sp. PCC 7305]|uniref:hypothetical protein n=1 Tax=Xenococcus sp. PCC 7305 TaxID=102125 RepID=UPI0002ABE4DA|nr:hypothetical protein [Xenococcus sp. PCC 7305]ELS01214.1 hypothetical protein Xen7305DRAFT_00009160 [Xenococcus sp. PCC 7305]
MEPITLSAVTAIATLAFQKYLETSFDELSTKFNSVAIDKMDQLRKMIWQKLRGNSDAENALKNIEEGTEQDLSEVATYLKAALNKDPEFTSQVQTIAQEINAGKLQDNSPITQNISDNGTGIIATAEGESTQYIAKEMHFHGKDN